MKRHLPNALTIGNLLSGMGGIMVCLVWEDLFAAAACVLLAAIFDLADGALARALHVSSPIGKDLDSLADGVTFSVLPAFMMVTALRMQGYTTEAWVFLPACLAVCGVLRLAKFNNDPGQAKYFSGLPTPAAALGITGLAVQMANQVPADPQWLTSPSVILGASVLIAGLMVSPFKLISFKLGMRTTWPYWLGIVAIGLASLPLVQGLCTLAGTLGYVVLSQVYFARVASPAASVPSSHS